MIHLQLLKYTTETKKCDVNVGKKLKMERAYFKNVNIYVGLVRFDFLRYQKLKKASFCQSTLKDLSSLTFSNLRQKFGDMAV